MRLTGAPRAALVATLAALLTERLGDVASGAAWPEVIDALLVLEPGDGTERRLCAWHAARMERPDHADVQRAGEYLIARLAPTHGAVVREQAQTALIARAGTQPIADALVLVDAAIRLGAPGAAAADGLAAWYLARGNDRHDEMAALGERLVDWLPSPAATTVRPRVVAHLRARVSAAHGRSARIGALQRLLRMATDDRAAQTQLATEQGARRRLRLQVGAVAAVVALVAILIVWGMP